MFGNRTASPFGSGRQVCKFFLEGRCRFGDNCKNEHPSGQSGQTSNRFAALNGDQRGRSGAVSNQDQAKQIEPDNIKSDLTTERPAWPLSSYGPGKNPPRNLISAELERSPEEERLLHYIAITNGTPHETAQREASLIQNMDSAIKSILNDLNGAVKYVTAGYDEHPNRIDIASGASQPPVNSTFGQTAPSNNVQGGFGQPSTFGQPSSLTAPKTSAFGQPSALNKPAFGQSTFGQPSQPTGFAKAASPAFGQSGFGAGNQTSAFGKPSAPQSSFGQPNTPQSTFGQPSAFGAASQPGKTAFGQPSAFGAAAQPAQQSTFGAPSAFGAAAAKTSPFATAASPQPTSAFGTPSAFGAAAQKPSPFASTGQANTANPFAAAKPAQSTAFGATSTQPSPFGQSSTFGQPSQPSAFGQPSQPSQPSAFGQPSQPSPFAIPPASGQPAQPSAFGQPSKSPFSQPAPSGAQNGDTITSFKGRPVDYNADKKQYTSVNPQTGKAERIWFPKGAPDATAYVLAPPSCYEGELGKQLEKIYLFAQEHGVFENGIMPEIPPQREWVSFDI